MRLKHCPHCGQSVETHEDGSFVMHSTTGEALCRGTNCTVDEVSAVFIGEFGVRAVTLVHDPDMSPDLPPDIKVVTGILRACPGPERN